MVLNFGEISLRRPNIPDDNRCIRQPGGDSRTVRREGERFDPGARRFDRLDLLLVAQPEDANDSARGMIQQHTGGDGLSR
jgi:hypothetical protein